MFYNAEPDPLCYPGTTVLRNKADVRTQSDLDDFEYNMLTSRGAEPAPPGNFDLAHYQAIHRHLFQDVYEWAGELRSVRTGKGGNWFCYPEHIPVQASALFGWLAERDALRGLAPPAFIASAAYFLGELNAIHAFREGNGRTQLSFLKLLVEDAGYSFNDEALDPDRTLAAMIASFSGNLAPLEALIADIIA